MQSEHYSIKHKFKKPQYKAAVVLSYIILLTLFDSYYYGIVYQQKMAENKQYKTQFTGWMFEEHKTSQPGVTEVPNYRLIQKSIEIGGLLAVLYLCGIFPAIGIALSHFFMSYDLLFYLFLKQTAVFSEYEKFNNTYWLQNWYQAGYFLLNPFNTVVFYTLGFAGITLAVTLCFAKIKKPEIKVHKIA